jgi:hypothetical protein
VWCNSEYELLIGKNLSDMHDKATKDVLNLPEADAILQHESEVTQNKVWMYSVETLPGKKPRTSLRFPILRSANGSLLLGVISAEFRQNDTATRPFRQQSSNSQG